MGRSSNFALTRNFEISYAASISIYSDRITFFTHQV
jgi:hypothetical protein